MEIAENEKISYELIDKLQELFMKFFNDEQPLEIETEILLVISNLQKIKNLMR